MEDYKAKQAARAAAAKAMQAAFPNMIPNDGKRPSRVVAAANIRIELKAAFPGVKFSVKTKSFSGGDDIWVGWIDGPMTEQVDLIIQKYSGGSFDGMTDCYNYSRDAWTDAFGDSKYVFASRNYSDAAIESCIRTVRAKYAGNFKRDGIESVAVDDFRNNRLWNVDLLCAGFGNRGDLQSLISAELGRRTWALNKSAKRQEDQFEVAPCASPPPASPAPTTCRFWTAVGMAGCSARSSTITAPRWQWWTRCGPRPRKLTHAQSSTPSGLCGYRLTGACC